jgi:PPP family 3-phenylpropionic acid transporter
VKAPRDDAREPSAIALGAGYFANFGALAVYGPFLAVYLAYAGLTAEATAELLALLLLVRVVATPAWTLLADKLASTPRVLRIVSVGAALTFALVLARPGHAALTVILVAFSAFRAPFGALLDALVLRWVSARPGRAFGRLRAWGTAAYMLAAVGTGVLVTRFGPRAVAWLTCAALAASALVAFALPSSRGALAAPEIVRPLGLLLRRPRFLVLLATAVLHEVGLAPYDALFPAHLASLATPFHAGLAVAVGASAELVFMMTCAPLFRRLGPAPVLTLAYAASAVRWGLMAVVTEPGVLVALQVMHALGFGAFYLASIAIVDEEAPAGIRASAQGVFSAFVFGIAAAMGLSLAGVVTRHVGIRGVFAVASVASVLGALLSLAIRRPRHDASRGVA